MGILWGLYRDYIRIMGKEVEATFEGFGFP